MVLLALMVGLLADDGCESASDRTMRAIAVTHRLLRAHILRITKRMSVSYVYGMLYVFFF